MFNNKGQSLVLFILLIPILLGIMALVIDVGQAFNQKNELDNTIEFILDYALSSPDTTNKQSDKAPFEESNPNQVNLESRKTDIEVLLNYNLKNNNNKLQIKDNIITITSKTYVEGIFSNIINMKGFEIESEYKGYLQDDKKVIERIK